MKINKIRYREYPLHIYALLIVLSIPFLYPFWWMLINSLNSPDQIFGMPRLLPSGWRWDNYGEAFRYQPFARQYFNSIYIAVLVTLGNLFFAGMAGYAFGRMKFRGREILFLMLLSSLMMPIEVTIVPNFFFMKTFRLINTHIPLILIPIFGAQGAFSTFMMRQYFITIPGELEEAAFLDGLSAFKTYLRIILPISLPVFSSTAILTFLYSWNCFLEPLVFIDSVKLFTIPLSLANFNDSYGLPQWHLQLAATSVSVIPILLVYVTFQKKITNAMAFSGLKG
ncbi:MAG: carbohydrate ABC transporter permease [Spirochaetales bacterium]|nr:carbohydrate ABC transporter permease [Spirochaetales bacterium]